MTSERESEQYAVRRTTVQVFVLSSTGRKLQSNVWRESKDSPDPNPLASNVSSTQYNQSHLLHLQLAASSRPNSLTSTRPRVIFTLLTLHIPPASSVSVPAPLCVATMSVSEADDDELVLPVPVNSHRFKRFGTVQFSDSAYTQSPLLSSLSTAGSLLVVSNRYDRLFLLSSLSPPSLLVASTSAVIESVESDKREQAVEAEQGSGSEGSKRTTDAAASPDVFVPVTIASSDRLRHLSLSPNDEWLLALSGDGAELYHISQFAKPTAGAAIRPLHSVELPDVIDVQWLPYQPSLLLALDRRGQLTFQQVTAQGVIEKSRYSSTQLLITAICASTINRHKLYLGHADGSLHSASFTPDSDGVVVEQRWPAHNPSVADFPDRQPALHFISQPSPSTLLLGYALSRSDDADSPDYLIDSDIERIGLCSLSLPTSSYSYLGDILQDELRMMDSNRPYSARHRYTVLSLPAVRAAVLYSNRAGETAILGPDPTDPAGPASSNKRWVAYEMQQDTDRAMVPSDSEWRDTYALGMAFDVTNRLSTADSMAAAAEQKQSELDAPMPLLFMLTTDARLHMYHFIASEPSMAEASRRVMRETVEEIPTSVSYPSVTSGETQRSASQAPTAETTKAVSDTSSQQSANPSTTQPASVWSFSAPTFTFSTSAAAPTFSFGSPPASTPAFTPSLFAAPATLSFGSPSSTFSSTTAASNWASLGSSSSVSSSASSSANPFTNGSAQTFAVKPSAVSTIASTSSPFGAFSSFSTPSFAPTFSSSSAFPSSSSSATTSSTAPDGTKSASSPSFPAAPTTFAALANNKKPGQWECDACLVMNDSTATKCKACETAKPGTATTASAAPAGTAAPQNSPWTGGFSFGGTMPPMDFSSVFANKPPIGAFNSEKSSVSSAASQLPSTSDSVKTATAAAPSAPTTFASLAAAAKQSTKWECGTCMVMNDATTTQCAACESKRPVSAASTTATPLSTTVSAPAASAASWFPTNLSSGAKLPPPPPPPTFATQPSSTTTAPSAKPPVTEQADAGGDDDLIYPVDTTSHRFKRFGTVQFSHPPYTDTEMVDTLNRVSSLLAVSNRYGRLFILSSSTPPRLLVASTSAVLESVEADKREQAEEKESDSKRVSDAAASFDVFVPVSVGDTSELWHLSLSLDEQWLLVMDGDQGRVYHISQFVQAEAEQLVQPHDEFEASDYFDVQWSPHHPSVLYLLDYSGTIVVLQVTEAGLVHLTEYNTEDARIIAMCISPFARNQLWLGNEDGSLHVATVDLAGGGLTVIKRYAAHRPNTDSFPDRQPALHFISQPSPSTLLLGYALSRSDDADSSDYLIDSDIERIGLCSLSLPTSSYSYLGDILQDELRMMDSNRPYSARHRYTVLSLPAVRAAVLYSNRAGETAILGPDPTDPAGPASSNKRWVAYEMQQDTDRAMVPSDSEWRDTYALGMAFDVTNRLSTADSMAAAAEQKQSELDAPMPLLFMLTTDARLHMYHFIASEPSMAEASRRVMRETVEEIPEEETYEEQFAVSHTSGPTATAPSPSLAPAAATFSQPGFKPTFPLPASSTAPPFPFGSPTTGTTFSSFQPSKVAGGSAAAPAQLATPARPAQSVVSTVSPFSFPSFPNAAAPSVPTFGVGTTLAATATTTSPKRSQKRSAAALPDQPAQRSAQAARQSDAPAPPTLAQALAMLAAALPHAPPNETAIALNTLRALVAVVPATPAASSSGSSASRATSSSPAPAPAKPTASVARQSRANASSAGDTQHPPERSPPTIPASLSRPLEYVSSLNVDDFRIASSSASETEKTFRHALTQLANEMNMLREITQESQQMLQDMYEPRSNAQRQHDAPAFSVHTAYRQQKQVSALRRSMDELSDATKEQEKALDDVLSYTQDNVRRVTALQLAEERGEDEEWKELIRSQPLSREAVQLTERIVAKLTELKKRRQELEEAVADEWKRVQGHGRVGYNEDELTVASVHRIIDSHRAMIEKQREEVRRLKDALRRGQTRTTAEERGGASAVQ